MFIIRKDKRVFYSKEAYDARTTKYNRLNQTSMHHKLGVKVSKINKHSMVALNTSGYERGN